jgi:hypothetical protein
MTIQFKVLVLSALVLSASPLLWPPARNLEYEYAIILTWLNGLLLPLSAYLIPQKNIEGCPPKQLFLLSLGVPLLAYVPGWSMFRLGLCQCVEMGFTFWYVLLVVPAIWLGSAVFYGILRTRKQYFLPWFIGLLPPLMAVVSLSVLWFSPQKRINSLFLGFLHGPIYDRWIPLDYGVVVGRLGHAVFALAILAVAVGLYGFRSRVFALMIALACILFGVAWRSESGGHGFSALNRQLSKSVAKSEVVVHFTGQRPGDEKMAQSLLMDAVFHIEEIKKFLNVKLNRPVHIYAYNDDTHKKILFGGGDTDITDVWSPSIHIELLPSPHPTLRHELVHGVSSFVSWHGLGFHPNMLLTEGLAMALAPIEQDLDFDVVAASMIRSGQFNSLDTLSSPIGFWRESGQRSYYLAGSFLRWLNTKYGAAAVRSLYSGQSFFDVTGQTAKSTFSAWTRDIQLAYDERQNLVVEKFTRDPGVLQDVCPHSFVDLARPRDEGFLTQIRQPLGWDPSRLLVWSLDRFPQSQSLRLKKINDEIVKKLREPQTEELNYNELIAIVRGMRRQQPSSIEDLQFELLQADLEFLSGNYESSRGRLWDLFRLFAQQEPGAYLRRQVEVRLALREEINDVNRIKSWTKYLAGWSLSLPLQSRPSWVEEYLSAKRQIYPGVVMLDSWFRLVEPSTKYREIRREWLKLIARGYADLGVFSNAHVAYKSLAELSQGESKRLAMEHARRMVFLEKTNGGD